MGKHIHLKFVAMEPTYKHPKPKAESPKVTHEKKTSVKLKPSRDMIGGHAFDMEFLLALEEYLRRLGADLKACWLGAAVDVLTAVAPAHFILSDKGDASVHKGAPFKIDKKDKFSLVVAGALGRSPAHYLLRDPGWEKTDFGHSEFSQVLNWILATFERMVAEALLIRASEGFLRAFDEQLRITDREVLAAVNETLLNRDYGGVGVMLRDDDGLYYVESVFPKSPAEKAKLERHDQIVAVDGHSSREFTLPQLAFRLKGEPGSELQMEILRDGEPKSLKVTRSMLQSVKVVPAGEVNLHKNEAGKWLHVVHV